MMLGDAGYDVACAKDAPEALEVCADRTVDLAILDVMLPGMDGFELCGLLRERDGMMPILMLSAKSDIVDKKYGFRAGADDYLGKPFNDEELLLRVEALLRRSQRTAVNGAVDSGSEASTPAKVVCGDVVVDGSRAEVAVRGVPVALTRKEFEIVNLLARHPGRVFTREDIIDEIWGADYRDGAVSIPTYVRRIRMKIEENPAEPQIIQTVFGFGYRMGG